MRKRAVGAVAVGIAICVAGIAAGCGNSAAPKPVAKPKPKGDPRPRVEGTWRVLYTQQDASELDSRATWTITPDCRHGACGFRVKSNKGVKMKVKFDKAVGDYTGRSRKFHACGDESTNEVFVDKAYVAIDQFTLSPTMGVKNARGAFATEMSGQREWIMKLRPEHADSGCDDTEDWQHADLRLVRVDPPKGRKFYGADPAAPQPTGAH